MNKNVAIMRSLSALSSASVLLGASSVNIFAEDPSEVKTESEAESSITDAQVSAPVNIREAKIDAKPLETGYKDNSSSNQSTAVVPIKDPDAKHSNGNKPGLMDVLAQKTPERKRKKKNITANTGDAIKELHELKLKELEMQLMTKQIEQVEKALKKPPDPNSTEGIKKTMKDITDKIVLGVQMATTAGICSAILPNAAWDKLTELRTGKTEWELKKQKAEARRAEIDAETSETEYEFWRNNETLYKIKTIAKGFLSAGGDFLVKLFGKSEKK